MDTRGSMHVGTGVCVGPCLAGERGHGIGSVMGCFVLLAGAWVAWCRMEVYDGYRQHR